MKQQEVKISVIIPVFNTASYLSESICSIMQQTFKEMEIIIIDDGSTDNSLEIINDFASQDDRIVVVSQENRGQSAARNRGLDVAQGEYLYCMDSDDILDSKALEKCFTKCKSENLDMVLFDGEYFFEDNSQEFLFDYKRVKYLPQGVSSGTELFRLMVANDNFSPSVCLQLIKREIVEKKSLRFHQGIIHEDNLFTPLLFLNCERVGTIDSPFFKRRIRGNSTMTSKIEWRNIEGYLTVASQILAISEKMSLEKRDAVIEYVSKTMSAVCYKARKLPLNERLKYISIILREYRRFVPLTTIVKVFIPKK